MNGVLMTHKRVLIALVLAIGAFTLVSAQQLIHHRSFNLVPLFPSGQAVGDVAFDGTNLYVSTWHSSSGTQTVSLVKLGSLSSLLSTPSGDWTAFDWRVDLTQAGGSRDTRLVYHNGSLYWGAGLGDSTNTGIRRYDLSGNLDATWAGDGNLSLSEVGVSRYDTIDIDPGAGGGATLAVGVYNSTIVRRFSLTDGSNAGNSNAVGGQTSTRDYAFAPNGDLYIRTQGRVSKASRVNDTTFYTPPVDIATWSEGTLAQAFVAYIPISTEFYSGFPDFVLYNQRVSGQNKVFIIQPDGTVVGELNGLEDTTDDEDFGTDFTEVTFDNTLLNASWGKTADGRMFIFVVKGGTGTASFGDRLDIYEVVPEPASLMALGVGLAGLLGLCRRKR